MIAGGVALVLADAIKVTLHTRNRSFYWRWREGADLRACTVAGLASFLSTGVLRYAKESFKDHI